MNPCWELGIVHLLDTRLPFLYARENNFSFTGFFFIFVSRDYFLLVCLCPQREGETKVPIHFIDNHQSINQVS